MHLLENKKNLSLMLKMSIRLNISNITYIIVPASRKSLKQNLNVMCLFRGQKAKLVSTLVVAPSICKAYVLLPVTTLEDQNCDLSHCASLLTAVKLPVVICPIYQIIFCDVVTLQQQIKTCGGTDCILPANVLHKHECFKTPLV